MLYSIKFLPLEERIVLDASIIYVDASAASGGDGSSWALAYNDLQLALNDASLTPGADQIWVADGVYKPSVESISGDARSVTFSLPDQISIYGGFSGNETQLSERNTNTNLSILSGDIGVQNIDNDNARTVVTVENSTSILMDGLIITKGYNDSASELGAGLRAANSQLVLHDMVFQNNYDAMTDLFALGGAGMAALSGSNVIVTQSEFHHNVSDDSGGAIVVEDSHINIENSIFTENSARLNGGAIKASRSIVDVTSAHFLGNTVTDVQFSGGGAIDQENSTLTIDHSTFVNNFGGERGGAVKHQTFSGPGFTTIENSQFVNNTSSVFGGAIFATSQGIPPNISVITINDSHFTGNNALTGGAIEIESATMHLSGSKFVNNTAELDAGAVHNSAIVNQLFGLPLPISTITDSMFVNNSAFSSASALAKLNSVLTPLGLPPAIGSSVGGGAVSNILGGQLIIDSSSFVNNYSEADGGAIANGGVALQAGPTLLVPGASLTVMDSIFTNNYAKLNGGAVNSHSLAGLLPSSDPNSVDITVSGSTFKANTAAKGGAIYLEKTNAILDGNTFFKSNEALIADYIYALDTSVNGTSTADSNAAINELLQTNSFQNLKIDDDFTLL